MLFECHLNQRAVKQLVEMMNILACLPTCLLLLLFILLLLLRLHFSFFTFFFIIFCVFCFLFISFFLLLLILSLTLPSYRLLLLLLLRTSGILSSRSHKSLGLLRHPCDLQFIIHGDVSDE